MARGLPWSRRRSTAPRTGIARRLHLASASFASYTSHRSRLRAAPSPVLPLPGRPRIARRLSGYHWQQPRRELLCASCRPRSGARNSVSVAVLAVLVAASPVTWLLHPISLCLPDHDQQRRRPSNSPRPVPSATHVITTHLLSYSSLQLFTPSSFHFTNSASAER